MKRKNLKLFTLFGLLAIVALQTVWLYNTYMLFANSLQKDCAEILENTLNKEATLRFKIAPKGTQISGPPDEVDFSIPYLEEGLLKLGSAISLNTVDSIASTLLEKQKIASEFITCIVNPKTNEILQTSNNKHFSSLGIIKSKIIPIRIDSSQGVQMILINPYYTIFQRMGLLLIATAIIALFVIACIIYQIKIIATQNKIAQIREDFSYAMIHDMKTPLSSIMMCTNFLHSGKLEDKPQLKEKYYSIVEAESDHLLALTNKVLTLSKLENNKLDMAKKTILIEPMLEDLAEKFVTKSTKKVEFTIDLKEKEVYADPEYLKEAISNLIDNAIKYSKESVNIAISSFKNDYYTLIKVYDNGIGISEKDQKTIFNKFERASAVKHTKKGGPSGFGLGLNYVYQVIDAHGGKVIVNSIEGEFSEFTLFIPLIIKDL